MVQGAENGPPLEADPEKLPTRAGRLKSTTASAMSSSSEDSAYWATNRKFLLIRGRC
jgi:hypothetical protein